MGINAIAKTICKPITSFDALAEAQALQTSITNQQSLLDAGYTDRTTASLTLTGSMPVVDDATHEANRQAKAQQELDKALALKPQVQPVESNN
jgi:hypothetical protein